MENKNKTYIVAATLNVEYAIYAESEADAKEEAKAFLLDKINERDVAYAEINAEIIESK